MSRGNRTSRSAIFFRAFLLVFVISIVLAEFWNWATGTRFWSPLEIAIASLLIVVFFGGFAWLVPNVGTRLLFRNDQNFRRYIDSGGDPYLDVLPKPLNHDSEITRETGLREPEYDSFVPPSHYKFQCPRCGARVEHRIDVCWACGYGEDGDSTDYYRRWGHFGKPDDGSNDQ